MITLLKHPNATDIAMQILMETWDGKYLVQWWRIGRCRPPISMGTYCQEIIKVPNLNEWEPYTWKGRQDPRFEREPFQSPLTRP